MNILGISAYYHDSAATIVRDGEIVAAAQEERFTRKRHDSRFPKHAIRYCLDAAGIALGDVDFITFYDKPLLKFERLVETYLAVAPKGFGSFVMAMPIWLKDKLYLKDTLRRELGELSGLAKRQLPKLLFAEHHQSHAASAFFPSPFDNAAVLCLDGVGEWATTTVWRGDGNRVVPVWEIDFPHSIGLLYSAFTYYTGFKVNSGEYKLMGLAPYGEPKYTQLILDHLIDIKEDGTFRLNMTYFNYTTGLTMTNAKFHALFDGPPRQPESPVTQKDMDIARSIQAVTEEVMLRLARTVHAESGLENLCLAGGVALNCVANGRILREGPFKNIWIQPAAGDAGGSLGAALATWYEYLGNERHLSRDRVRYSIDAGQETKLDYMKGAYLGPQFDASSIQESLDKFGAVYQRVDDEHLFSSVAALLASENVIGWFAGRMEFGPRALGSRSIIGDARSPRMQSVMNLKIKHRESFRPFAPVVLAEDVGRYFDLDTPSPYMLLVANVKPELRVAMTAEQEQLFGIEKLNVPRSSIPAVTHVDYSARVQTVHQSTNPRFHRLVQEFRERTGCSVLVNTSFNVRGEPIVCTVEDAYRCFMRTEMDYLVIENYVLAKPEQPSWSEKADWKKEFELD
jgi:carbamoyltransferase